MKIALISDIHANFEALAALMDVLETADRVLCLGDMVGYYCQVNEVIDALRRLDAVCIQGNHDAFLLRSDCPPSASRAVKFGIEFARKAITPANRRWLADLPLVLGTIGGGVSILMSHGSPWRPLQDRVYFYSETLRRLDDFVDFDIVAFGQTHYVLKRLEQKPFILNPGSVGQSREKSKDAKAMLIDTEQMRVALVSRPYDPVPVIELAKHHGAGLWITKYFQIPEENQDTEASQT